MRPLRLPARGPVSSSEFTEFAETLYQRLFTMTEAPLPPISTEPPVTDWPMNLLLNRIRKGGIYHAQ